MPPLDYVSYEKDHVAENYYVLLSPSVVIVQLLIPSVDGIYNESGVIHNLPSTM